jgi:hypothetical protein
MWGGSPEAVSEPAMERAFGAFKRKYCGNLSAKGAML